MQPVQYRTILVCCSLQTLYTRLRELAHGRFNFCDNGLPSTSEASMLSIQTWISFGEKTKFRIMWSLCSQYSIRIQITLTDVLISLIYTGFRAVTRMTQHLLSMLLHNREIRKSVLVWNMFSMITLRCPAIRTRWSLGWPHDGTYFLSNTLHIAFYSRYFSI